MRSQGAGLSFRQRGPLAPHPGQAGRPGLSHSRGGKETGLEESQAPTFSSSRPPLLRGWQKELWRPRARKDRTREPAAAPHAHLRRAHLHCTEQRGTVGFGAFYGSKERQNLKHLIFLYLKWR